MVYTITGRVRYSEIDEEGVMTPLSVINYLQDCSTFQSEELGIGMNWLKERGRAWFLSAWKILTDRRPVFGEEITVGTSAYDFKGIYGYRHFFIKDAAGNYLVRADSLWVLCDTRADFAPVKVTAEFGEPYLGGAVVEDLGIPRLKRKLPLPEHMEDAGTVTVQRHHLDTNHHVNNAQYVAIGLEAAGLSSSYGIQAEYRHAAVLGDVFHIRKGTDADGAVCVSLENGAGQPYAVLRFFSHEQ
ncbi:MAG: thioesterase [Eubacteriales bacterium]|nr:thioesterase [Eubacteriales bacterium]